MQELLDGIFRWTWFSEPHGYEFNGHLVAHPGCHICVDPVPPGEGEMDKIENKGVDVILLTNRNHLRAANEVKVVTGAPILMHPADIAHAREQGGEIDDPIEPGDEVGPFEVIGVPGKSPGEIAFLWRNRRLLLVGDCVVGDPPGALKLLPERVIDDLDQLKASVRALLELDVEALLVGDGEPILTGAGAKLKALVDGF
ncbi:MAG: hypothetical protein QNJ94_13875 [Alphaproteobacteria bacterium]|nr:hypothetical protein [Alphaproteobacteria bacterium]